MICFPDASHGLAALNSRGSLGLEIACPPDQQETVTEMVLKQVETLTAEWSHNLLTG